MILTIAASELGYRTSWRNQKRKSQCRLRDILSPNTNSHLLCPRSTNITSINTIIRCGILGATRVASVSSGFHPRTRPLKEKSVCHSQYIPNDLFFAADSDTVESPYNQIYGRLRIPTRSFIPSQPTMYIGEWD